MHLFDFKVGRFIAGIAFPPPLPEPTSFTAEEAVSDRGQAFFRENGYLVLRNAVTQESCKRITDYVWSLFPPHFERENPATWKGMVKDCICERTVTQRKGRVKYREIMRKERWILDSIRTSGPLQRVSQSLLGKDHHTEVPYIRGLYPVLPGRFNPFKKPRPHTDGHPFRLGMVLYVDDVAADGGGFHVWPGSHEVMRSGYCHDIGPGWTPEYHHLLYGQALQRAAREITGPAGTAVLWHYRLAHSAGFNRSSRVRQALLADYGIPPKPDQQ